jgi:hypothetical protein
VGALAEFTYGPVELVSWELQILLIALCTSSEYFGQEGGLVKRRFMVFA